jgi:hypothetical protein
LREGRLQLIIRQKLRDCLRYLSRFARPSFTDENQHLVLRMGFQNFVHVQRDWEILRSCAQLEAASAACLIVDLGFRRHDDGMAGVVVFEYGSVILG